MNRPKGVKLALITSDEQIPYQIEQVFSSIPKFIADEKPDYQVRLGDMLDMEALQGWTRKSPSEVDWESVRSDIAIANRMIDAQDRWLPRNCEKRYSFGNHEERLMHMREIHRDNNFWRRNSSTIPYLRRDLKLSERGYKVYGQNQVHRIGKLHFFHGNDWGVNHCRNNIRTYGVPGIVYGHVHTPERFTKVSPIESHPQSAWSLGCLCDRNPRWKNGAPNKWVHGFAIAYIREDGRFQMYPIDIIKGEFVAPSGKLYK